MKKEISMIMPTFACNEKTSKIKSNRMCVITCVTSMVQVQVIGKLSLGTFNIQLK